MGPGNVLYREVVLFQRSKKKYYGRVKKKIIFVLEIFYGRWNLEKKNCALLEVKREY